MRILALLISAFVFTACSGDGGGEPLEVAGYWTETKYCYISDTDGKEVCIDNKPGLMENLGHITDTGSIHFLEEKIPGCMISGSALICYSTRIATVVKIDDDNFYIHNTLYGSSKTFYTRVSQETFETAEARYIQLMNEAVEKVRQLLGRTLVLEKVDYLTRYADGKTYERTQLAKDIPDHDEWDYDGKKNYSYNPKTLNFSGNEDVLVNRIFSTKYELRLGVLSEDGEGIDLGIYLNTEKLGVSTKGWGTSMGYIDMSDLDSGIVRFRTYTEWNNSDSEGNPQIAYSTNTYIYNIR